jgi:hypothetical protein
MVPEVVGLTVPPPAANVKTHPPVVVRASSPRVIQLPAATQLPAEQSSFVPQKVPSGSAVPVSVQTDVPVAQESVPVWQGLPPGVQATPAVHATQEPALQTWFVPHEVPDGSGPVATHTGTPAAQLTTPWVHDMPVGEHSPPAVHALHAPRLQTMFVPHEVPLGALLPVGVQVGVPVAQLRVPSTHGFDAGTHAVPATQSLLQRPSTVQTAPAPHAVPADLLPMRMQVSVPPVQSVA